MDWFDMDHSPEEVVDANSLRQDFIHYLKLVHDYSDSEADLASVDMLDAYDTPYVLLDYEGELEIGGSEYSAYSCRTDFNYCGLFHMAKEPPFLFAMLIDKSTLHGTTVGDYCAAEKKYILRDWKTPKVLGKMAVRYDTDSGEDILTCPFCGKEAVIGEESGFCEHMVYGYDSVNGELISAEPAFLSALHDALFENTENLDDLFDYIEENADGDEEDVDYDELIDGFLDEGLCSVNDVLEVQDDLQGYGDLICADTYDPYDGGGYYYLFAEAKAPEA